MRASHHLACGSLAAEGAPGGSSRGICHSSQALPITALSLARNGSSTVCHRSQMSSIRGLLAIDFSVICGTRS
jgi:hypothetical protein